VKVQATDFGLSSNRHIDRYARCWRTTLASSQSFGQAFELRIQCWFVSLYVWRTSTTNQYTIYCDVRLQPNDGQKQTKL